MGEDAKGAGSTRKTGDEERAGIDPGGTRPTQPARRAPDTVESGDRNPMTHPAPATKDSTGRGE